MSRRIRALVVALLAMAGLLTATGSASAAPPGGVPLYIWFPFSTKCVSVPNDATGSVGLTQWGCVNKTSQQWSFHALPENAEWGRLVNANSGLCMAVQNGWTSNGVAIVQETCVSSDKAQHFTFTTNDNLPEDNYWLRVRHSGKAVNVSGASTANGAKLIQYPVQYAVNEYVTWRKACQVCP